MITFLIGVAILILGYFTYGKFVERVFGPDDRKTPALANPDGVDRVPMPHWKNVLIQLLNIAGIGPVIGVILAPARKRPRRCSARLLQRHDQHAQQRLQRPGALP